MVPFLGKFCARQTIRGKPHPTGIKVHKCLPLMVTTLSTLSMLGSINTLPYVQCVLLMVISWGYMVVGSGST